jgi:LynF/TruF/PatF family peptide O-prenyltransferase
MAIDRTRLAAGEDLSINPLMWMYDFHKKEFGLENNKFISLLEELLSEPPCSILECSPKVTPKGIHPARFRLGYQKQDIQQGLVATYRFLDRIEAYENVLLNRKILDRIVDKGLDFSRIITMGIGLDSREKINDSKVKYFFMINEYPEKVKQVLSLHPPVDNIDDYLVHEELTFGIDMYFDGRTGIEIYLLLKRQDLRDGALMRKLNLRDPVLGLTEECGGVHVSFHGLGKRVLHFHPQSPTRFVHLIDNRRLSLLYSNVQILKFFFSSWKIKEGLSVVISLMENEIISENIQNINLHYCSNLPIQK